MTTLAHRRLVPGQIDRLVEEAPERPAALTDDHRRSLSARFRAVATPGHRRLDAWNVEQAGRPGGGFRWSPASARRALGNGALRRLTSPATSITDAVRDEVADQLLRAAAGYARTGSMASWLASSPGPVVGLVTAEAVNWATQLCEITADIGSGRAERRLLRRRGRSNDPARPTRPDHRARRGARDRARPLRSPRKERRTRDSSRPDD
jgi:hypothetical protein